jgi:hypothetical protein
MGNLGIKFSDKAVEYNHIADTTSREESGEHSHSMSDSNSVLALSKISTEDASHGVAGQTLRIQLS